MADITTTTSTKTSPHKISVFEIPELTAEIGKHLSFYNYVQCLLVSKSFYNAFCPLLWKDFDPPLDTPFADPSLIQRNLHFIQNITLSVLDHDLLPIFTDGLAQPVAFPYFPFREQVSASETRKGEPVDKVEESPLTTAVNNLHLHHRSRLTNLTTLTFFDTDLTLTPQQHLLFHSNILTLLLNNPYLTTLHIPADLLSLFPKLFLNALQHNLPHLEQLELGPLTSSKAYTGSPSSASNYADLGLDNSDNDNVTKAVSFSGEVTWETTVQLLETCLRKRKRLHAPLTRLRCLYNIPEDVNTIPPCVLRSQLARVTSPSVYPSSFSAFYEEDDNGDDAEEPRIKDLTLPYWGPEVSAYSYYLSRLSYPNSFIFPLINQLPYLAQFSPNSWMFKRHLEGEHADGVRDGKTDPSRDRRHGLRRGRNREEQKDDFGPRYRWCMATRSYYSHGNPCSICSPSVPE